MHSPVLILFMIREVITRQTPSGTGLCFQLTQKAASDWPSSCLVLIKMNNFLGKILSSGNSTNRDCG